MTALHMAAAVVLAMGIASVVAYFTLAVPAMRNATPIPDDHVIFCRWIVRHGK